MQEISLFPTPPSKQKENFVTNYCGLMLKLIYENNPVRFEKLISQITSEDNQGVSVLPQFEQQKKADMSIPDMQIIQRGYALYFETKITGDSFKIEQIEKHIEGIRKNEPTDSAKVLFLLANYQNNEESLEDIFGNKEAQRLRKLAEAHKISLIMLSFENFLEEVKKAVAGSYLEKIGEEFEYFLSKEDLLPRWKYLLDVVNCGKTIGEFARGYYVCPAEGSAYHHKKAKYLGGYNSKKVAYVAEVAAMAVVGYENGKYDVEKIWNDKKLSDEEITKRAIEGLELDSERIEYVKKGNSLQIFILADVVECNFQKDTSGGMFGSKVYFELDKCLKKDFANTQELAEFLNSKKWSDFNK